LSCHSFEPLPRDNLLSETKANAEGGMSEAQIVLGWKINTCTLIISLPDKKFEDWLHDLEYLINVTSATTKKLEMMDGHLNHVGHIIS